VEEASFEKMRAFRSAYVSANSKRPIRVLDVGSGGRPGLLSFRELFAPPKFDYVGLDIDEFHNVDFVPGDPFCWTEIESESFDLVVSGSMLEHNPYFWITVAEIARVMAQDALAVLIAPSTGYPHRYPLDCWRFYPDSWSAMCTYVGLELVETYREPLSWRKTVPGTYWREAMMVARKHPFGDEQSRADFYRRIDAIVATRTELPNPELSRRPGGPAATRYEQVHTLPLEKVVVRPQHVIQLSAQWVAKLKETRIPRSIRQRIWRRDGRLALEKGEALMPWPPDDSAEP
jgi:SAM-dependent methyltransferase